MNAVQNRTRRIDGKTAHRMMNTRLNENCIIGSRVQRFGKFDAVEIRIRLRRDRLIPRIHCFDKIFFRNPHRLCQLFIRLARHRITGIDITGDYRRLINHRLIDHQPRLTVCLAVFSIGNRIARTDFVEEAIALFIHKNRPVAAQSFGNQVGISVRINMYRRM